MCGYYRTKGVTERRLIKVLRKYKKIENTRKKIALAIFQAHATTYSWLTTNRPHMVRATYLIASASNEEKWSNVTNGRTLILIVSYEIYLSDMSHVLVLFSKLSCCQNVGIIVGVQFAIQSVSMWFKCKRRRVLVKKGVLEMIQIPAPILYYILFFSGMSQRYL